MSRYIDAEKVMGEINRIGGHNLCEWETIGVKALIDRQPTADVVEVRHGRWIFNPDGTDWGIGAWKCSLCKCKNDNLGADNRFSPHIYAGSNFCPHCGAKMYEERKD
jgi:hypothetical protein